MKSINLVNKKVISILNKLSDFMLTLPDEVVEEGSAANSSSEGQANLNVHPASLEFLNLVMSNPDQLKFAKPKDFKMFDFHNNMKHIPPYVWKNIAKLTSLLGTNQEALAAHYPKKGYIGWHHNCDAPGLNVLFTYSENGNGCFKYRDSETKEIVTIPDKKGWTAKVGYYPRVDHKGIDSLFWHAAETEDKRMTVAFVIGEEDVRMFWEKMIEQLETE